MFWLCSNQVENANEGSREAVLLLYSRIDSIIDSAQSKLMIESNQQRLRARGKFGGGGGKGEKDITQRFGQSVNQSISRTERLLTGAKMKILLFCIFGALSSEAFKLPTGAAYIENEEEPPFLWMDLIPGLSSIEHQSYVIGCFSGGLTVLKSEGETSFVCCGCAEQVEEEEKTNTRTKRNVEDELMTTIVNPFLEFMKLIGETAVKGVTTAVDEINGAFAGKSKLRGKRQVSFVTSSMETTDSNLPLQSEGTNLG